MSEFKASLFYLVILGPKRGEAGGGGEGRGGGGTELSLIIVLKFGINNSALAACAHGSKSSPNPCTMVPQRER